MSEETTHDHGILAPGGSAPPGGVLHLPGATTLDYSMGQEFQKVESCSDQERFQNWFLQSGRNADMLDEKVSVQMMDAAMPLIETGTANFGFIFNQQLKLGMETSCFDNIRHFEKTRVCGKGASGEVQAFRDERTQLSFVRKRYKKGSFLRKEEVQSLIRLSHPGVVKVFALLCARGTVDLLLQDAGHPLRDCLKIFCQKGILAESYWKVVQDLSKQGFEALSYIHRKEICHLDIKPENLLVHQTSNRNLVLVVGDFGSSVTLTQPMTFGMGLTPEYWAPELWREMESHLNNLQTSHGSERRPHQFLPEASFDVYAMGLCVYFMTSQQHLMKQLEAQQNTDSPLVPLQDLHQACQLLKIHKKDFVFQLHVMKQHSHQMPQWAAEGHKLFPRIPSTLLTVIRNTLDPNPEKRSTADQAATTLSGGTEEHPAGEARLRPPITVEDTSTGYGERDLLEESEVHAAHEAPKQQAPEGAVADPRGVPLCHTEQLEPEACLSAGFQDFQEGMSRQSEPESLLSARSQRFKESMSQLMKLWDQNTAGPSQRGPTTGPKHFPMRTTTYHMEEGDIEIGSDSWRMNDGLPATSRPQPPPPPPPPPPVCQAGVENKIKFLRGPKDIKGGTDVEDCSAAAGGIMTEVDLKMGEERESKTFIDSQPLQMDAMCETGGKEKGKRGGGECRGAEARFGRGEMSVDCKVMRVSGNLEALSVHCNAEPFDPAFRKPVSAVGGKGKGLGKRKAVGLGGKGEGVEHREGIGKVMASSATTKPKSPRKGLRGKSLPVVSSLQPNLTKIPFVVASSSRPKPSTRTMPSLPLAYNNPSNSSGVQPGSPVADGGSWDLVQLRDVSFSFGRGQLGYGDGTQPSGRVASFWGDAIVPGGSSLPKRAKLDGPPAADGMAPSLSEQLSPLCVENHPQLVSGNWGATAAAFNQPVPAGVSLLGAEPRTADPSPACLTAEASYLPPSVPEQPGVQPGPMLEEQLQHFLAEVPVERLQNLFDAMGEDFEQIPVDLNEESHPQGERAWPVQASPPPVNDTHMASMSQNISLCDGGRASCINKGGPSATDGQTTVADKVGFQGNVPDLGQLLDL